MAIQFPRPSFALPTIRKEPVRPPQAPRPEQRAAQRHADVFEARTAPRAPPARTIGERLGEAALAKADKKGPAEKLEQVAARARVREAGSEVVEALRERKLRELLREAADTFRQHQTHQRLKEAGGELAEALRERQLRERLKEAGGELAEALRERQLRERLKEAGGELAEALREYQQRQQVREAAHEAVDALREHQTRQALEEAIRNGGLSPTGGPEGTGSPQAPAQPATTTWNVQPGDTVGDIAWSLMQQGVPGPVEAIANQIVSLNNLADPNLIIAGSTLTVPAPPGTPPTTNGPPSEPGKPANPGTPTTPGTPANPGTPGTPGERYPVPYISQMSSNGTEDDWNAQSNCGPTTMAMIAKAFGLGEGMSDGAFINQLANSIGMGAEGTGYSGIEAMASNLGLQAETNPGTDVGWIQQQLEAGNLVAVNGNRGVTAANENPPYASGSAAGGHWIAVTGMTPEGNFIVKDPSTTCRELTPSELQRFLAEHQYGGFAVAIHPPPGVSPSTGTPPAGDVSAQGQQLESLRLAPGAWSLAETGFAGQGGHLMKMAEKYNVPIDLAMAMLWKESQWGTTGLSAQHNNPGNLKFVGQEGAYDAFTSSGAYGSFAGWPSMEQGIEAYFKLLGTHYRQEIDSGNWEALIHRYAPPSENDTGQYIQQVYDYAATVRQHLGLE